MAPVRLSKHYKNQLEIEKAARKLDMPFDRWWRHYWAPATATRKGEASCWVSMKKNEFNSLFDSRVRHMHGEKRSQKSMLERNVSYDRGDLVAIAFWHNLDDGVELLYWIWKGLEWILAGC